MEVSTFLIAFIILIIFCTCISIIKYILNPLFFKPRFHQSDIDNFLFENGLTFIELLRINKKEIQQIKSKQEKNFMNHVASTAYFKVICYSSKRNEYILLWVSTLTWHTPFIKKKIYITEEINKGVLTRIQEKYKSNVITVTNTCPACNNNISLEDISCCTCDLNFS